MPEAQYPQYLFLYFDIQLDNPKLMHFSKYVVKIQCMNVFQEQQQDHFHYSIIVVAVLTFHQNLEFLKLVDFRFNF